MTDDEPEIVDDKGHLNEEAFQPWDAPLVREHNLLLDTAVRANAWELRCLIAAFAVPYLYLIATSRWFSWVNLVVLVVIFAPTIWRFPKSVAKARPGWLNRRRQAEEAAAVFELADAVQHDEDREAVAERLHAMISQRLPFWRLVLLMIAPMVMLAGLWLLFGGDLLPTLVGCAALLGVAAVFRHRVDANADRMADIAVHLLIHPREEP